MAFVRADLAEIEDAIKSGTLSWQKDGRRVQYQSMGDLIRARDLMLAEIEAAEGAPRRRVFRVYQSGSGQ